MKHKIELPEYSDSLLNKCIHEIFEDQVKKTPKAIAIIYKNIFLTYEELNKKANQLANYLRTQGVVPETVVGISLERSDYLIISMLAILKAGGAYLVIDPNYPQDRITYIINDIKPFVLLTQECYLQKFTDYKNIAFCLKRDWFHIARFNLENLQNFSKATNLAYIIYTSGSTGKPKGVEGTHQGAVNRCLWMWNKYPFDVKEVCCQKTSINFVDSVWEIFGPLLKGIKLIITSENQSNDVTELINLLASYQVTRIVLVPSLLQAILNNFNDLNLILPTLKLWTLSGEALSIQLVRSFFKKLPGSKLLNLYGSTEVAADATYYEIASAEQIGDLIPIGKPITNMKAYILNERLELCDIGMKGDLYIGGVGVARGYFNKPELTKECFIKSPFSENATDIIYKTGDLARYLSDGNIEYLGRIDQQVKIRGFRIELNEIEVLLNKHPAVREAVVIAREDIPGEKRLIAYIISNDSLENKFNKMTSLIIDDLRKFLESKLPNYMLPGAIVALKEFPLNYNGKIDRNRLPDTKDLSFIEGEQVAPKTQVEQILSYIVVDLLRLPSISTNQNLLHVGLDSLLATQLINKIHEVCKVKIKFSEIFKLPTIMDIAQQIESEKKLENKRMSIEKETHEKLIPLSYAQSRMWFMDQVITNKRVYNLYIAVRFKGYLSIKALKEAFNTLLQRHESLRTVFPLAKGKPMQQVLSNIEFPLTQISIENDSFDKNKESIKDYINAEINHNFNLEKELLIRGCLISDNHQFHILIITLPHIISDGWSNELLCQELSYLYNCFKKSEVPNLPIYFMQYRDFVIWQRKWIHDNAHEQQFRYWKNHLEGLEEIIDMPFAKKRPIEFSYKGSTQSARIEGDLLIQLKELAATHNCTLFMVFLACYYILLYRYTGKRDIVIGTVSANRHYSQFENLVGLFVNTLPLRIKTNKQINFSELLNITREVTISAYDNQDLPFDIIVDALKIKRDLKYHPIFQVMFVLQNVGSNKLTLNGLKSEPIFIEDTTSKFDLYLEATQNIDSINLDLHYATDLFSPPTMKQMIKHFVQLLSEVVHDQNKEINYINYLTENERMQLLFEWNNKIDKPNCEQCIHHLFEQQVIKTPNNIAISYEGTQLTYNELNIRANKLAYHLRGLKVNPETLIAISLERSLDLIVGILAILKSGGAYVPLDPSYPIERLKFILDDTNAKILLTKSTLLNRFSYYKENIFLLDTDWHNLENHISINPPNLVNGQNLAYIIYTSGSTGKPKGVLISHLNVCRLFASTDKWYHFSQNEVWTLFHSYAFDFSVWEIWGALFYGSKLIIVPYLTARSPALFYKLLSEEEVTILNQTPSAFHQLVTYEASLNKCLPLKLRKIIFGGEALEPHILRTWYLLHAENQPQLVNMYGITEATVHVTYNLITKKYINSDEKSLIGSGISDLNIYILDDNREPVPIGVPGELYVGGAGIARGYLNRPELTKERFIKNPFSKNAANIIYKTGDLARYLSDGNIEYLGRIDQQVKVRGFRIELGEIEALLNEHPAVREAVVIAREDIPGEKRLVAYIVSKDDVEIESDRIFSLTIELKEILQDKLPNYMVPSAIVTLKEFPLTHNGKLDRNVLPAPQNIVRNVRQSYIPPLSTIESKLATIWSKLLHIEKIGRHDNFFDIGGDSIISIQIANQAKQLGISISVKQVIQFPTIAELASIAETSSTSYKHHNSQGVIEGDIPLTPIQIWFFKQNFVNRNHYNQALFLDFKQKIDSEIFGLALKEILKRHDVLRSRFLYSGKEWIQYCDNLSVINDKERFKFTVYKCNPESKAKYLSIISKITNTAQANLDIEKGWIFNAIIFDNIQENSQKLFLVIHHLVIDSVSWRILLEDLELAYNQIKNFANINLMPKSSSYQDWAIALKNYVELNKVKKELSYWDKVRNNDEIQLPIEDIRSKYCDIKTVHISLTSEDTVKLIKQVPQAYHTQVNDVLLTALMQTLYKWAGKTGFWLNLEGHGRENIINNIDISGAIGWFTTIFPVYLNLKSQEAEFALQTVQKQLKNIPNKGINFGILCYLLSDQNNSLAKLVKPQLCFNYLGQWDNSTSQSTLFNHASESVGSCSSDLNYTNHLINIDAQIIANVLQIDVFYRADYFSEDNIKKMLQIYKQKLEALIEHCCKITASNQITSSLSKTIFIEEPVLEIQVREKDPAPLFMIHPASGLAFDYLKLAKFLPEKTIFGINNPRFGRIDNFFTSINEMALNYVELIKPIFNNLSASRVILGGWSFGGFVAIEMARLLKIKGIIVDLVIMIDSEINLEDYNDKANHKNLEEFFDTEKLDKSSDKGKVISAEFINNRMLISKQQYLMYDCPCIIIKAQEDPNLTYDPYNGWKNLITNVVDLYNIQAKHFELFNNRNIIIIGNILKQILSKRRINEYKTLEKLTMCNYKGNFFTTTHQIIRKSDIFYPSLLCKYGVNKNKATGPRVGVALEKIARDVNLEAALNVADNFEKWAKFHNRHFNMQHIQIFKARALSADSSGLAYRILAAGK